MNWCEGIGTCGYSPPPADRRLPRGLERYYKEGERLGVPERYKCSHRDPWYMVTDVQQPDAFLTYMNWVGPRVVLNATDVDCTNTLHRLSWRDEGALMDPRAISLALLSSVSQLGAELVGRVYGGGVLKLEPGPAQSLWVAPLYGDVDQIFQVVAGLLGQGHREAATVLIDNAVAAATGLSTSQMELLRHEVARMRRLRMGRKARAFQSRGA